MNIPIGNYSNEPNYDWPCKNIEMTASLIMFDVKNQTFIPTERTDTKWCSYSYTYREN